MTNEHERVKEIFSDATERCQGPERDHFVHEACHGDHALEAEVRTLLDFHERAGLFLTTQEMVARTSTQHVTEVQASQWSAHVTASDHDEISIQQGSLLAERYRIGPELGRGGSGVVFRANDEVALREVAVKILHRVIDGALYRRELASFRLLRLPGVAELLDEGSVGGRSFLVTSLIEGDHFPGRAAGGSWHTIESIAIGLLESLARIHWAGVIHGDIKEENVLVGDNGDVTILDLGLAVMIGSAGSPSDRFSIRGTWQYLAPELLTFSEPSVRSDLYAVGVLLYRSLTGRFPHHRSTPEESIAAKLRGEEVALDFSAPESVRELIRDLLAVEPERRPADVSEVLARCRDEKGRQGISLPLLGQARIALELAIDRLQRGEAIAVAGRPGAGKTRFLEEISRWANRVDRSVFWFTESTKTSEGQIDEMDEQSIVLIDDGDRLPTPFRSVTGPFPTRAVVVVSTKSPPGSLVLRPLTKEDLRELFRGPDRLLHLQEDGALELWRRTGGLPSLVSAEVQAWIRAGIARYEDRQIVITRESIDLLRSGFWIASTPVDSEVDLPEAHTRLLAGILISGTMSDLPTLAATIGESEGSLERALNDLEASGWIVRLPGDHFVALRTTAEVGRFRKDLLRDLGAKLPYGSEARLFLLLASNQPSLAAAESLRVASRLRREGGLGNALAVLQRGLLASRQVEEVPSESELLEEVYITAFEIGTVHSLNIALYEFGRAVRRTRRLTDLENTLRAAIWAVNGNPERAVSMLDSLGTLTPIRMERWRQSTLLMASSRLPKHREVEIYRAAKSWASNLSDLEISAASASWSGWLSYRNGAYEEAARYHHDAADMTGQPTFKAHALLSAASAEMECGRLTEVKAIARAGLTVAKALRDARLELRAEWLIRASEYRSATAIGEDADLVSAAWSFPPSNDRALVFFTEAAAAWRADHRVEAVRLASAAASDWAAANKKCHVALARALAVAAGAPSTSDAVRDVLESAIHCDAPDVHLQIGALLRIGGVPVDGWPNGVSVGNPAFPKNRLDVLSVEEAIQALSAHSSGPDSNWNP